MKLLSLILSAAGLTYGILPSAALSPSAKTYFNCGFEEGIPEDFTFHDVDSRELHFTMVQLGFNQTDSWTLLREEGTENHYMASASRFKTTKGETPSPAQDWMITPPIWIRDADATMSWRGMSVNDRSSATSSYKICVSTKGAGTEDFISDPVAVLDSEEIGLWTNHEISLGQFVGERIYIAFVNTSTDSDVLAIDDITVKGSAGLADLEIIPGEYTLGSEEIALGGRLTATSAEIVNTLSITFDVAGEKYHADYSSLNLSEGDSFEFELPEKISADYGETISYSVSSEVNGVKFDDMHLNTTLLAFMPTKRVVVEEATGMWCGYCPEGIAAMEIIQQRHPDTFIGIAVHVEDPLTVTGYGDSMSFPSGAPTAWVDRKDYCDQPLTPVTDAGKHTYTTLKGGLESMFLDRMSQQTFADVEVKSLFDQADRSLKIDVTSSFAMKFTDQDFRIALLLTEDKVWKPGYYQTNYHSGRDENLFGFEALPSMIVSDFEFNHVARGVYESFQGIKGSLPSDIDPGKDYSYSIEWVLPQDVDPINAKAVAMVVDARNGEVLNANTVSLVNSGVDPALQDSEYANITVYDMAGTMVMKTKGSVNSLFSTLSGGLYVVRIVTNEDIVTRKITIPSR